MAIRQGKGRVLLLAPLPLTSDHGETAPVIHFAAVRTGQGKQHLAKARIRGNDAVETNGATLTPGQPPRHAGKRFSSAMQDSIDFQVTGRLQVIGGPGFTGESQCRKTGGQDHPAAGRNDVRPGVTLLCWPRQVSPHPFSAEGHHFIDLDRALPRLAGNHDVTSLDG